MNYILLVLGFFLLVKGAGFVRTLHVEKSILFIEFPFLLFTSILLIWLSGDILFKDETVNISSRFDGIILLILFAIFLFNLIKNTLKYRNISAEENSVSINNDTISCSISQPVSKSIAYSILGMLAIIIGGKLVVSSGSYIASTFGATN